MEKWKAEKERDDDDDDDGDDSDEICEVMNGTKKVSNECLFIVFTSQELEAPMTWLCYVMVSCRILSLSTYQKKKKRKTQEENFKENGLNF